VAALEKHYERAEVEARRSAEGLQLDVRTRNVAQLILSGKALGRSLSVDGKEVVLPAGVRGPSTELLLDKQGDGWTAQKESSRAAADEPPPLRKMHGRQGPIDDAFAESFLCVRPTGAPRQKLAQQYAMATLAQFTAEFSKWMRGAARVKDDAEVTPADIAAQHLILFGDPGSNKILGQIADRLPIRWGEDAITLGGQKFSAADHVLVMIYPNPLNPARYVVINSGHTFHEKEFRGTNALLFPHLGDYAVLRLSAKSDAVEAAVEQAGIFGERWELPPQP
jgi:hypothetical protein